MSFKRRLVWVLVAALTWIIADQLTKAVFKSILKPGDLFSLLAGSILILPSYNHGAFLSLGAALSEKTRDLAFIYGNLVILAGLFVWGIRSGRLRRIELVAIASIVGGGLSNLLDRVFCSGQVFDFINMGIGNLRTGIFNVADIGITLGVVLLFLGNIRRNAATSVSVHT